MGNAVPKSGKVDGVRIIRCKRGKYLEMGSIIKRPMSGMIVARHFAVVVGYVDRDSAEVLILHKTSEDGENGIVSLEVLSQADVDREGWYVKRQTSVSNVKYALERYRRSGGYAEVGEGVFRDGREDYCVETKNCEHFITDVEARGDGRGRSKQVDKHGFVASLIKKKQNNPRSTEMKVGYGLPEKSSQHGQS
jgi:hypothetical protein